MPTKITRVHARQIIDSRANPIVEAEVTLTSTGEHEALELRVACLSKTSAYSHERS